VRWRVALVAFGIVATFSAPAAAGRTASARVEAPADGATVTGTVDIAATGHSVAGIKRVEILIDSWSVAVKEPAEFTRDIHVDYAWDTTRWPADGSPAPNGRHTIVVEVTSLDGDGDKASVAVLADNPPTIPTGVSASARRGRVTLTWDPSPEPDVREYLVERDDGDGFVEVGRPVSAELVQTLVPGDYSYRVTAIRDSATGADGIASESSAPVAVSVAAVRTRGGAVSALGRGTNAQSRFARTGRPGRASLAALLSGGALPGQTGLPPIPSPAGIPWGDYDEELPYGEANLPGGGRTRLTSARGRGQVTLLPADGPRWVAAGLLLIACAGLALVTAVREVARSRDSAQ
jgi:hypothetical protein